MADQKITELPIKTSSGIATTDYLFGIDSSEGYQMLIKDLGDYIIQHVSSSLAGSNQTLAAAISALNSNALSGRAENFSGDVNTLTNTGYWYASTASSNIPSGYVAAHIIVLRAGTRAIQIAFQYGGTKMSARTSANSGASWGAWNEI